MTSAMPAPSTATPTEAVKSGSYCGDSKHTRSLFLMRLPLLVLALSSTLTVSIPRRDAVTIFSTAYDSTFLQVVLYLCFQS